MMSGKIGQRESPFGKFNIAGRQLSSKTCHATIVVHHYSIQNQDELSLKNRERSKPGPHNQAATRLVIEDEIVSLRVSKSLESSGSFEARLVPSRNWKSLISPGDWVMIYMYDRNTIGELKETYTQNMLMLGNVDRVARSLSKEEESDKVDLRYVLSGRGIGKVFENTDVWFNPYLQTPKLVDAFLRTAGLELVGRPNSIVENLLKIFLGPGGSTASGITSDINNWFIPPGLGRTFGASDNLGKFYSILAQEITPNLPGYAARQMLSTESNGSLMELLRRGSNELVNQLYFEDVRNSDGDVKPTIVLKPRPVNSIFFNAKAPAALNGKYSTLQKLAKESFVEISQAEIKYEDLGKDDHSKFNMFWLTTPNHVEGIMSQLANRDDNGPSNPTVQTASIARNGLRRFDHSSEFCYIAEGGNSAESDVQLFQAFMEQTYDFHAFNHLYDAGTITCLGVLEAELGKALVILADKGTPGAKDKVYYIEGYEHEWSHPTNSWTTTFTLSHGQWLTRNDDRNVFIDAADSDFGTLDQQLSTTYLAKTVVKSR